MAKHTLLTSSTDETSSTFIPSKSRQQMVGQISITGTQTVTLNGRIGDAHNWVAIQAATADELFLFTNPGELQVVTTGTTGGSSITSVNF